MLVGAGGNAGNQSAIKVIRGLATGSLQPSFDCLLRSLRQQVGRHSSNSASQHGVLCQRRAVDRCSHK